MLNDLKKEINSLENKEKAKILSGFFKTGKGQYGEGDIFLGITVPELRKIAKKYSNFELEDIKLILQSKIHEYRLIALLILIFKFKNTNDKELVDLDRKSVV